MAIKVNVTRQLDHLSSLGHLAGIALPSSSKKVPADNTIKAGLSDERHEVHLLDVQLAKFNTVHSSRLDDLSSLEVRSFVTNWPARRVLHLKHSDGCFIEDAMAIDSNTYAGALGEKSCADLVELTPRSRARCLRGNRGPALRAIAPQSRPIPLP